MQFLHVRLALALPLVLGACTGSPPPPGHPGPVSSGGKGPVLLLEGPAGTLWVRLENDDEVSDFLLRAGL